MNNKRKIKKRLIIFLSIYLLSYVFLTRASLYINGHHNLNGYSNSIDGMQSFYYIPVKEIVFKDREWLLIGHIVLYYIYYPAYAIDYCILSGPCCSQSLPMWELL